jgi:hypothetical protein
MDEERGNPRGCPDVTSSKLDQGHDGRSEFADSCEPAHAHIESRTISHLAKTIFDV